MDTKEPAEISPHLLKWLLAPLQNAIKSWRRNFSKLTLIVILPALCFIFLSQLHVTNSRLSDTTNAVILIVPFNTINESDPLLVEGDDQGIVLDHQYQAITSDTDKSVFFDVFKSLFLVPFLVLSPLPIASVFYYVATRLEHAHNYSNYTTLKVTFTVWKRLLIISHQGFVAVLLLATLFTVVLTCVAQVLAADGLVSFLEFLYQSGLVYLCMVWQMTVVLNVLHEAYTKINNTNGYSKKLIRDSETIEGKIMWAEAIVLFTLIVLCTVVKLVYETPGVHGVRNWNDISDEISTSWNTFGWILYGIDGALSISLFSVFALVVQASLWDFSKLYRLEKLQNWCSLLGQDQDDHRQEEEEACQEDRYRPGVSATKVVLEVRDEESIA